jgi:hypothetical protein
MDDFLYLLKLQLEGRIPQEEVDFQIRNYESYINEETAGGKPLESVLRYLGDPSKIADIVVENYHKRKKMDLERRWNVQSARPFGMDAEGEPLKDVTGDSTAEEINAHVQNPKHGIKAEYKEGKGWDVRLGRLKLNGWTGTLLILLVVVVIYTLIKQML